MSERVCAVCAADGATVCSCDKPMTSPAIPSPKGEEIAKERADWLLDAVACATQDRRYLRGDDAYDAVAGDAILLNAEKAIRVAIERALLSSSSREEVRREALADFIKWADRNDWGTVPKELEARMRTALSQGE